MDPTLDVFVAVFVIMMVVGFLGWIVWIVVVVRAAKKIASGLMSELNSVMPELEKMAQEIQDQVNATGSQSVISESDKQQFAARLIRAAALMNQLNQRQAQYRQLNQLGTQRYRQRLGELHSVAAQAGIDWSPPRY
jgi:hypothetical protein